MALEGHVARKSAAMRCQLEFAGCGIRCRGGVACGTWDSLKVANPPAPVVICLSPKCKNIVRCFPLALTGRNG